MCTKRHWSQIDTKHGKKRKTFFLNIPGHINNGRETDHTGKQVNIEGSKAVA